MGAANELTDPSESSYAVGATGRCALRAAAMSGCSPIIGTGAEPDAT